MAQYRNFLKRIKTFPTYTWKGELCELQEKFIRELNPGEIFVVPGYGSLAYDSFKKKYEQMFNDKGVVFDRHHFKIKVLKKDYPHTAIVLQKGEETYNRPIEDAQTFDPNSILKEKGV